MYSSSQIDLEILTFLKEVVNIDSKTENIKGVNLVQNYLESELFKLGLKVLRFKNPSFQSGDLLVANTHKSSPYTVALVCHADTARSLTKKGEYKYDANKRTATGTGILDDKGGMAIALGGIKLFKELCPNHKLNIKLVSSPNEESGSRGLEENMQDLGREVDLALGFEPGQLDHSLISRRSGNRWYQVFINGKSGHSGRFDSPSVSAVHEASRKIVKLLELQNIPELIRLNIGDIESSTKSFNVVSDHASFKLDFRFPNKLKRDTIHKEIIKILNSSYEKCIIGESLTTCHHTIEDDCPPLENNSHKLDEIVNFWRVPGEIKANTSFCGGASDLNYFIHDNNIVLDGLGAYGHGMHSEVESIDVEDLFLRIKRLACLLVSIEKNYTNIH